MFYLVNSSNIQGRIISCLQSFPVFVCTFCKSSLLSFVKHTSCFKYKWIFHNTIVCKIIM